MSGGVCSRRIHSVAATRYKPSGAMYNSFLVILEVENTTQTKYYGKPIKAG